jgi:hypothetical protein
MPTAAKAIALCDAFNTAESHHCSRHGSGVHEVHSGCCVAALALLRAHLQQGSDDGVFSCQLVGSCVVEGDRHTDTGGGEHLDQGVTVCLQDRASCLELLRILNVPSGEGRGARSKVKA